MALCFLWSRLASTRIINYSGIISAFFFLTPYLSIFSSTSSLQIFSSSSSSSIQPHCALFKFNVPICISNTFVVFEQKWRNHSTQVNKTHPNEDEAEKNEKRKKKYRKNIMIEMNNDFSFVYWLMRAQSIIGISCLTWAS